MPDAAARFCVKAVGRVDEYELATHTLLTREEVVTVKAE